MIALAGSLQEPAVARLAQSSSTPLNFVASSGSPMTPVEASTISPGRHPSALAAISAVSFTACAPVFPVNALALPELTTNPRALPPCRALRHQSTGADGHLDRVNTPAAVVPFERATSRTSVRFL